MIQIKPLPETKELCDCGGDYYFAGLIWQGLHVCEKSVCKGCNKIRINSLPINQSGIEQYSFFPGSGLVLDINGNVVPDNWYSSKLKSIANPSNERVEVEIDIIKKYDQVLILNTLDFIYGHSLLFLLNLQRIITLEKKLGIIIIVQPMLKWLVPKEGIAEIWTVKLGFKKFNGFYPDLSDKINSELNRFQSIWLSKGHLIPTIEHIKIENFTGIKPYDFLNEPKKPLISFIWREDPDRLWIRNIYLLKIFKKLGLSRFLIPFHHRRIVLLFRYLNKKFGDKYIYSVTGLGNKRKFPSYIKDNRIQFFNEEAEKKLCRIYAESYLVIGVHGSGMLLPSAHAGMTISLMPSKRWGNFAEDILFRESDVRLASFQKRIVPLNLCIHDICDIATDMITGRNDFVRKFVHSDEL